VIEADALRAEIEVHLIDSAEASERCRRDQRSIGRSRLRTRSRPSPANRIANLPFSKDDHDLNERSRTMPDVTITPSETAP